MGAEAFRLTHLKIRITMNISFDDELRKPYSFLENCLIDTGLSYSMHLRITDEELAKFCGKHSYAAHGTFCPYSS